MRRVHRRPITLALAAAALLSAPAVTQAAGVDALLAQQGNSGGLSDAPRPSGGISDAPRPAGSASTAAATASADELPFTGSDPRITLLLGLAAILAGAGLRMRTGDARDF